MLSALLLGSSLGMKGEEKECLGYTVRSPLPLCLGLRLCCYNLDLVDLLVKICLQVSHTNSQHVFVCLQ